MKSRELTNGISHDQTSTFAFECRCLPDARFNIDSARNDGPATSMKQQCRHLCICDTDSVINVCKACQNL